MTVSFDGFYIYVLVFARLAGLVFFNPLLSRRNVPTQIRAGLVLLLTILVSPSVDASAVTPDSFDLIIGIIKELFIGFLCGFVYQVFYYLLLFAGDWLDTEFGMAMAKVFDPATNMQISVTGNLLTLLFTCYLFATGSHLVLIQIFALSFRLVPLGAVNISPEAFQFALTLFVDVFSLALRLLLPFTVAEFSLQIVLGIMMKLVPQIHAFVINFQLKLAMGLTMLLLLSPIIASFIDNYITIMLENIQRAIVTLA